MERFEYVTLTAREIVNEESASAAESQAGKKKWAFLVRVVGPQKLKETVLNRLNTLGSEGWELAGVTQTSDRFIGSGGIESALFILKRSIEPGETK